jgi:hypothetical protein
MAENISKADKAARTTKLAYECIDQGTAVVFSVEEFREWESWAESKDVDTVKYEEKDGVVILYGLGARAVLNWPS